MNEDNAERHVIFVFAVLLLFFVGLTFFVVSIVRADNGQNGASSSFHVPSEMRSLPRSRWRRLAGRKNPECSGPCGRRKSRSRPMRNSPR